MPRKRRIQYPGARYHIIGRGNEKRTIYADHWDYKRFLSRVGHLNESYGIKLHAYCLMPNHYHLLLEITKENLSIYMKKLLGWYATYFNKRHDRVGGLFQGRFKSYLIDNDTYFLEVSRYIHLNPCKSNLIDRPEDYEWSSMSSYIAKDHGQVETKKTLSYFKSIENYYDFVFEGSGLHPI